MSKYYKRNPIRSQNAESPAIVSTFYLFIEIKDLISAKNYIFDLCRENQILGTILLADEGMNATICGTRDGVDAFYNGMLHYGDIDYKETICQFPPFSKLKVKIKPEIIRIGKKLDMGRTGKYVEPQHWDEFISQDNLILIDVRNDYEFIQGSFVNAINPETLCFTEFPDWLEQRLEGVPKEQKIAMFCTGGVRCEKSTALAHSMGYSDIYHLRGGVIAYLAKTKNAQSNWHGNCFIFDDRLSLDSSLNPAE